MDWIKGFSSYGMVDKRHSLSYREFLNEYALPGKPVIVTDLMEDWPAMTRWTLTYFKERFSNTMVTASSSGKYYELKLEDYIDYISNVPEEDRAIPDLYLNWRYNRDCPELRNDYETPHYVKDWLRFVPNWVIDPYSWIYIGPDKSGSPLHQDIDMTHGWNALISGRKHWVFFSPDQSEWIYRGKVDAFSPDFHQYPLLAKARPLYAEQNPGEIVFVPSGWWHQVRNEGITIAVTENYVNAQCLNEYLRVLSKDFIFHLKRWFRRNNVSKKIP